MLKKIIILKPHISINSYLAVVQDQCPCSCEKWKTLKASIDSIPVCSCVLLVVCKMWVTWIRLAAGFRRFSKCFCLCCSWTFRAKPEPRIPWESVCGRWRLLNQLIKRLKEMTGMQKKNVRGTTSFWKMRAYLKRLLEFFLRDCCELTAGRAKKATPIKLKVAAIRRPFHVTGNLSP